MMPIRNCRRYILILSISILWCISKRSNVAGAFDGKILRRPSKPPEHNRRTVLKRISFLAVANIPFILLPSSPSNASEDDTSRIPDGDLSLAQPMSPSGESRPSAPLDYLLPAARVGIYIYQLFSITDELTKLQQSSTRSDDSEVNNTNERKVEVKMSDLVAKLDSLLSSPPSFIKTDDPTVSRGEQYGKNSLPILGEIGVAARKQKERRERSIDVGFAPQFFEVGELVGERRQWSQLQKAEKKREGTSEVRRAFNIYTTNLNFSSNKYQWVGTTQEKSRLIRSDRLPTTTDVIRSDLDARDLYRNQVQTSLDDARAEFEYQKKESSNDIRRFDATDLFEILGQAKGSVDKWFGFIPDSDVKLALEAVQREKS